jgi:adapter protein MecA 1/2
MEFKRINKDTVTCIITEDDMDEQGIKLEDLFEKKKEAMEFLHDVMRKAEEEVDYKPTGSFMPMQITVLPDHSISLTLSENASASFGEILKNLTDKAGIKIPRNVLEDIGDAANDERINRLNEYLKSLKQITSSVKDMVDKTSFTSEMDKLQLNKNETVESSKAKASLISSGAKRDPAVLSEEEKLKRDQNRLKFHEYVFLFEDIHTVMKFCSKVPADLKIESSLYKNEKDGKFYLDLKRENEDPKVFAGLFTMAYEFAHFQATNKNTIAHMKESYELIIANDAISQLASAAV